MTITVAMALSGLEPDQWNDGLKDIYMQGAILFPKSPSTLSLASSGASSYYSIESGISSMSPDSASYNPLILSDLDSLGLDGIIQIQDYEDIKSNQLENCTKKITSLMSKDESIKLNTSYTTVETEEEHDQSIVSTLLSVLGISSKDNVSSDVINTNEEEEEEKVKGDMPNNVYTQVMYQNRDLLNLFDNIKLDGWKYQAAILPEQINNFYFENRSQYSRLQDVYPPKHAKATCRDKDCAFVETKYF